MNLQIALRAACFCAVTHSCLHCASLPLFFLVFFCCPGFVFSCFACTLLIITLMPFLLSFLLDDAWCPVPAVCLLGAHSSQNSTCVSEGEVAHCLSLVSSRRQVCVLLICGFPLVFNLGDFKKPGQVQRNPPQNKKAQFLHQYKSRALGVGYFSELQSVKFDPFANPAIPHLQQKASIHDPWGRGASTCVSSFGHIHITDWGSHQAYRLAQLGSPKSAANRNFLGPNLPAKRGEREREKMQMGFAPSKAH